jgi:acyl carrier protein
MKETLAKLIEEIAPGSDLEDVELDEDFREALDLDSFDFLKLMEALEKQLDVRIPEADYPNFATLEKALAYLAKRR